MFRVYLEVVDPKNIKTLIISANVISIAVKMVSAVFSCVASVQYSLCLGLKLHVNYSLIVHVCCHVDGVSQMPETYFSSGRR